MLAVNACRLLWNSLTVLRHYINQQQQLLPHCKRNTQYYYTNNVLYRFGYCYQSPIVTYTGPSASLLYGISLQCLYLGADVLLEVYSNIDRFCEDQQVTDTSVRLVLTMLILSCFV